MTIPRTIVEVQGQPEYMIVPQGSHEVVELPDGAVFSVTTLNDCALVKCAGEISLVADKGDEIHGLSVTFEQSSDPHNY
jgi:hypothetical protein